MAPRILSAVATPRQLAPTVGPKALGVLFRAGILGGIGETIAVGHAEICSGYGYVHNDASWMLAYGVPVESFIVPVGDINIYIGYTAAAFDSAGNFNDISAPTRHPLDQEIGAHIGSEETVSQESATSDFDFTDASDGSIPSFSQKTMSDLQFIGTLDESEVLSQDSTGSNLQFVGALHDSNPCFSQEIEE